MDRVMVVVLNYHTNDEIKTLLDGIFRLNRGVLYDVFIGNTQPSTEEIAEVNTLIENAKAPENINVYTLVLDENMGYARGNNYIIRKAIEMMEGVTYNYVLIANPDIAIEDGNVVDVLIDTLKKHDDVALVGPKVLQMGKKQQGPYRKGNPIIDGLKFLFPVVWVPFYNYRQIKISKISNLTYTWRVIGCFMLMKFKIFESVGFFDEETFLYGEEDLLSVKLGHIGKKVMFVPFTQVIHNHKFQSNYFGAKSLGFLIESNKIYLEKMGFSKAEIEFKIFALKIHAVIRRLLCKYLKK